MYCRVLVSFGCARVRDVLMVEMGNIVRVLVTDKFLIGKEVT